MRRRNMKKVIIGALLSAVMIANVLTGCGSAAGEATASASNTEEKAEDKAAGTGELTHLEVAASANMVSSGLNVIAKYGGFYEEEGLDVNLNAINGSSYAPLLTGKLDVTAGGASEPLMLIDKGNPLVMFGGAMGNGANLYCLPERADEFKELTQETLSGKKIGTTRGTSGLFALFDWFKKQGIDTSEIEIVELDAPPTIVEAVRKGEVDLGVIYLTFRNTAEEQGFYNVAYIDELEDFICCRLTTTTDKLKADRDTYVHFLKANIKAYRVYKTDEDKAVELMKNFLEIDESVIRNQLYEYGHLVLNPNPEKDRIIAFYDSMFDLGYVEDNVNIGEYVDISIFEDAITQLLEEEPDDPTFKELYEQFKATNTQ